MGRISGAWTKPPRHSGGARFRFEAEEALEFNLHYHLEGETIFDQQPKILQTYMGNFTPKENAGYYCLMWGNPAEKSVSLNFRFEVLKP